MGIGCALFLWTLLAVVGAGAVAFGLFVVIAGRRSKAKIITGVVVAAIGAVVFLGAAAFVVSWLVYGSTPHESTSPSDFRAEFGFQPADLSAIRTRSSGSTDSTERFMRFHTSEETIARIVDARFRAVECEQHDWQKDDKPDWWTPLNGTSTRCYSAEPFNDAFASNEAWLAYDPASREARFYYIGID